METRHVCYWTMRMLYMSLSLPFFVFPGLSLHKNFKEICMIFIANFLLSFSVNPTLTVIEPYIKHIKGEISLLHSTDYLSVSLDQII